MVQLVLLGKEVQGLVVLSRAGQFDDLTDISSSAESSSSCSLDHNNLAQVRCIPSLYRTKNNNPFSTQSSINKQSHPFSAHLQKLHALTMRVIITYGPRAYLELGSHVSDHAQVEGIQCLGAVENKGAGREVLAVQHISLSLLERNHRTRVLVSRILPCTSMIPTV